MQHMFPSEHQEQQVLQGVTTSPSTIRLTWRNIPSSQGYRLEWREGEGQALTLFFSQKRRVADLGTFPVFIGDFGDQCVHTFQMYENSILPPQFFS